MNTKITFCENCRKDVSFSTKENFATRSLKGDCIEFVEILALCEKCNEPVFVSEFMDLNLKALYDAYRLKNDIVSLEHICEIPVKYAIGKRPLSVLLGWGELTLTRYCDGDMPIKQYADILQHLYDDPSYFLTILEDNKTSVSPSTYKKSKDAILKLMGKQTANDSKLNCVVKYLFNQCDDITNLALQKSLYYIQGFYHAFYNTFLFEEDCEAWIHGPVYREIYQQYSNYKFDPIGEKLEFDESCFSVDEKVLIDSVVKNLCCYSGRTLEAFTHIETPWLKTRGDLAVDVQSARIIAKDLIGDYFSAVKDKYTMLTTADVKTYSTEMFEAV